MGKGPSVLSEYMEGGDCFMEGSLSELAGYRLERAKETLSSYKCQLFMNYYKLKRNSYLSFKDM